MLENGDDPLGEVARGERLVALGAHDLWGLGGQSPASEQNETLWRSPPRADWGNSDLFAECCIRKRMRKSGHLSDAISVNCCYITWTRKRGQNITVSGKVGGGDRFDTRRIDMATTKRRSMGGTLTDWILFGVMEMKLAASSVLCAISGIRSIGAVHVNPGFTKYNWRYTIPLKALARGVVPKMKTPAPVEMPDRPVMEYKGNGGINMFLESITGAEYCGLIHTEGEVTS